MKPYKDNKIGDVIIREFDPKIPTVDLVWHRDKEDRRVTVVEGIGWEFQMDNELPVELKVGDVIDIPKEKYHRVKQGQTKLVVKIEQ